MQYISGEARKPSIFVSSTCYDLKQIRRDIREFIEADLGYEAILSEYDSFPIDPDKDTINNCLRVVEQRADIMVLIVGSRYGYITDHGEKSITNLEYLRAKAKGIPIFVFIDQKVSNILPVWKKNKEMNFSDILLDTEYMFKGAIAENYIAQTFRANNSPLYYWKSNNSAEIDFLLYNDDGIIPVEVKANNNTKSKSLKLYMEKYNPKYSIRISTKNFGYTNNIKSIPLYAAFLIK